MAYKALYRKYRPSSFEEMAGQKHIVQTLKNAVNQNKIAHAYLFCGPRGTGKTSTAKIFAKAINCTGEIKPCDECENCLIANEGSHPDIIEIDAASNNGVEEVRNLIEKVKYAPLKGKYKIYIIDEVHMMSKSAYNALLKTIEEPPAHVIFIFATTEPFKVLPTILSRCQRFDFSKISREDIITYLDKICKQEDIKVEDEVLEEIAVLADGGMRDALSILDQCYAYAPKNITLKDVYDIYGVVTVSEQLDIIGDINAKDTKSLIRKIELLDQRGIDIKRLTSDLIELLKEKVIFDYTNDENMLNKLDTTSVINLVKANTTEESLKMIDILMESYEKYRYAADIISYLEIALLKMMSIVSRETKKERIKEEKQIKQPIQEKNVLEESITVEDIEDEVSNNSGSTDFSDSEQDEQTIITDEEIEDVEEIEETIEEVSNPIETKKIKQLDDDFILSLLAGATKEEKQIDQQHKNNISKYEYDLDYAKYVALLKPATLVASGNNYLVVAVENQTTADEINELDNLGEMCNFMEILIKKRKRVFAISLLQCDHAIEDFRYRLKNNMLPDPAVIEVEENEKEEKQDETMDSLNFLFGEDFDVKEGE